jgi:phospho-N-acetylmuramoyl-pentapeptide-transferase
MLYRLYEMAAAEGPVTSILRLLGYNTFRIGLAAVLGILFTLVLGAPLIRLLHRAGIHDTPRDYGVMKINDKKGTPQMGGVIFALVTLIVALLTCDLSSRFFYLMLLALLWFTAIGASDDYLKIVVHRDADAGLSRREKMLFQGGFGLILALVCFIPGLSPHEPEMIGRVAVPFIKGMIPLWILYVPFVVLVVLGISNAINLTDGMDGLATGPSIMTAGVYTVYAYILSHAGISNYLLLDQVKGAGEVAVFLAALFGSLIGFLWYNSYPATVFMGDAGSLAIGGVLATAAVLIKQELLFLLAGFLFCAEFGSSLIQDKLGVGRGSLGMRLLSRAPVHDAFRLRGLAEPKVVVRMWIVAGIAAMISILALKLR